MTLPNIEELLASLNRMRRDSIRYRDEALAAGDKKLSQSLNSQIKEIENMIRMKGARSILRGIGKSQEWVESGHSLL